MDLGGYDCIPANRISRVFHFNGPGVSVAAACASSLVAVHKAKVKRVGGVADDAEAALDEPCHKGVVDMNRTHSLLKSRQGRPRATVPAGRHVNATA